MTSTAHPRVEVRRSTSTGPLRVHQGSVGVPKQPLGVPCDLGRCDPDRHAQHDPAIVIEHDGLVAETQQPGRECVHGLAGDVGADHDELVAGEPADQIIRARPLTDASRDLTEDLVPGPVAEAVVDELEPIDATHEHARPCDRRVGRAAGDPSRWTHRQGAVRQARRASCRASCSNSCCTCERSRRSLDQGGDDQGGRCRHGEEDLQQRDGVPGGGARVARRRRSPPPWPSWRPW